MANNHSLKEVTISTFIYQNHLMHLLKGLIDNNSINNINFIECLGGYINDNKVSDALVKAFVKDNINKIDLSYNEMGLCGDKITQKHHIIKNQSKDSESRSNTEPVINPLLAEAEPTIAPLKPKAAPINQQRSKEELRKSWAEDKARMKYPSFAEAVKKERNNVRGTNLHASTKL